MGCHCLDVANGTGFCSCDIAVAHQHSTVAFDTDDAMNYIATAIYPCQYDVAHLRVLGLLKDDTLFAPNDKRQHATSLDGEGNIDSLAHQSGGFL